MIDHTGIGVSDVAASALFYDAALGALGLRRAAQFPETDETDGIGYGIDYPVFWIVGSTRIQHGSTLPSLHGVLPTSMPFTQRC